MKKSLPIMGKWWLSDNFRRRIPGELFIDNNYGLCLKLNGCFFEPDKIQRNTLDMPIDFIFGKIAGEEDITLKDSILISYSSNSSIYKVYSVFSGIKFKTLNDVRFNVVNVSFNNLNKWVSDHFFDDNFGYIYSKNEASINVQLKPIDLGEISGFKLRIKIKNLDLIKNHCTTGFHFDSVLEILDEKPRLFDEYLDISKKFSGFLSFATLKPAFISKMDGIITHERKKDDHVDILLRFRESDDVDFSQKEYFGLIPYRFIEQNITQVVLRYFELVDLYYPVYDLYLTSIWNPSTILENEFQNLVEGLEAYHRRKLTGKYVSNEKYEKEILPLFLDVIPAELDTSFKEKLKNAMKYLNEYSLRKRIIELIRNLPKALNFKIQKDTGYRENIIKNIVLLRNHFAHFDPNGKKSIPKGPTLLQLLNEEMRLILEVNILQDLGLDIDHISKFVRITKRFHH